MPNNETEDAPKESKTKQRIKILSRLLISIIAFVILFKYGKVNIHDAVRHLLSVDPLYLALSFISYMVTIFLAGKRFFIASSILGFKKNYLQCIQLNFIGSLFNNFLPTTFGGDAIRGYYLKRGSNISLSKAVSCLICERYVGMVILFWASSLAFILQDVGIISKTAWKVPDQMIWFSHGGTIFSLVIMPFLPQIGDKILGKTNWFYKKFIEPGLVYWHDLKLILRIFILSFFLQIFVVLCHIFIAMSLNIQIPLSYYLVFYPLTTIAGFLIPSLNGLGIREGTYIYFLSKIGIDTHKGLAFGLGWLIILFLTSIIGGVIYFVGDFREHKHHGK